MIGNNLKMARQKNQLTQAQVASRLHISPKTISSWENNHSAPDLDSLVHLGAVYQCSMDSLLATGNPSSVHAIDSRKRRGRSTLDKAAVIGLTFSKIGMIALKSLGIVVPSSMNVLCNIFLVIAVAWMLPTVMEKGINVDLKMRRMTMILTGILTSIMLTLQLSLLPFDRLISNPDRIAFFAGFVLIATTLGGGIFISLHFFREVLDAARMPS